MLVKSIYNIARPYIRLGNTNNYGFSDLKVRLTVQKVYKFLMVSVASDKLLIQ